MESSVDCDFSMSTAFLFLCGEIQKALQIVPRMVGGSFMGFVFFAITAAAVASAPVASTSQSVPELDCPDIAVEALSVEVTAKGETAKPAPIKELKKQAPQALEAFTGKITGSRVRVRLQPGLDGVILKELNQGELVIVTGELDDFYAVKPEPKCKGYVYRAYVLDNIVEANNVNLRLEPDIHAPILTQLGQGDIVKGTTCPDNNKWLMVDLPDTVRFYIAKDFIANVGDVTLYKRIQNRRQQLSSRLESIDKNIQAELKKPFAEVQLVPYVNDLKTIVAQNQDLPELADKAQALIKTIQEQYLQLSLRKPLDADKGKATESDQASAQAHIASLETSTQSPLNDIRHFSSFALEQQENNVLEQALHSGKVESKDTFYADELKNAQEISGQLVPYDRPVKNRPGDFMLVDVKTKVPVAYLYSNRLDLNQFAGQPVHLMVSPRPNHHFALPAFFVLEIKS